MRSRTREGRSTSVERLTRSTTNDALAKSSSLYQVVNIYIQEWKSCLEPITPDSPYMLLENGEYATLPENLNFIFEVDDLENELPENIVEQVGIQLMF